MDGLDALKISEEKKRYILEDVNPLLEEMVAECIRVMPKDPVPFILQLLEEKKAALEDKLLSEEDRARIMAENEELGQAVTKVKSQMKEAVKSMAAEPEEAASAASEESEEDDDDDEPPEGFYRDATQMTKARQSVSAEAYGDWNKKKEFVSSVIPKTDDQKARLRNCLQRSFLFSSLEANDLGIVVGAMKEVHVPAGTRVINQGDDGNELSVIENGTLECLIRMPDGSEKVVASCTSGDVFGELALLYNCPRAASVDCKEAAVLWQLDRDTFNHIVKEAAQKKRQRYDVFLSKVPLLSSMDNYERSQLADALKVVNFEAGTDMVKAGDVGDSFYIIEEGEAAAYKNGAQVMSYGAGDYFGELALLRNQPRAATVTAKSAVNALSLDARSFNRLLNVQDLLARADKYS
jgi:cAMP-dependent protein kinase regulator